MQQKNPHRKQIRLKEYDYSAEGYYFITICTQNRKNILSNIVRADSIFAHKEITSTKPNANVVGVAPLGDPQIQTSTKPNPNIVGADSISARIRLNKTGEMINNIYLDLENQFKYIKLHDYVIMPNYIHGIIEICERADMESAPTVNEIIQTFKRYTTVEYIKGVKKGIYQSFNKRIWQRNYYEHVIRNEKEYYKILEYIQNNPLKWEEDKYFEM